MVHGWRMQRPARPTIYLFDIDGTLVDTAGAGRRALALAFERRYGRADGLDFSFDGMTDRAIVAIGLAALQPHGLVDAWASREAKQAEIDALLEGYVEALRREVEAEAHRFVVYEGVSHAVDLVRERAEGVVGLGTGNIRKGAALKLEAVGLYERFAFGGFGCDHEDRAQLLAVGAARGAALLGRDVSDCRVLVIGDTPKDVAAAHAIGARCLGVATGRFGVAELKQAGADDVADSLATAEARRALVSVA